MDRIKGDLVVVHDFGPPLENSGEDLGHISRGGQKVSGTIFLSKN